MTDETNPWKRLSSKTVYENPWIRLEDHEVVNPSGNRGQYGKVCFKSRAVAILAVEDDSSLWLVGQYRYTLDEYSWELPMGGAGLDEDPLEAARRELAEETGLTADSWQYLMRLHTSNSVTDEAGHLYLARGLGHGQASPEETEQLQVRRLAFDDALQWVLDGRITDAISVAGILRLAAARRPG